MSEINIWYDPKIIGKDNVISPFPCYVNFKWHMVYVMAAPWYGYESQEYSSFFCRVFGINYQRAGWEPRHDFPHSLKYDSHVVIPAFCEGKIRKVGIEYSIAEFIRNKWVESDGHHFYVPVAKPEILDLDHVIEPLYRHIMHVENFIAEKLSTKFSLSTKKGVPAHRLTECLINVFKYKINAKQSS